jgi:hypothetical protein
MVPHSIDKKINMSGITEPLARNLGALFSHRRQYQSPEEPIENLICDSAAVEAEKATFSRS